jgi:pyruvate dehydrogenase E2 component (dihydrolipoamide acetyltransferase)
MDVRLPRLGEGSDSGTVASVFVKEGDQVKQDQALLELESEKAVATIPSPAAGKVTSVHVKEGDEIKVGQLIVSLDAQEAAAPALVAIDATVGDEETAGAPVPGAPVPEAPVPEAPLRAQPHAPPPPVAAALPPMMEPVQRTPGVAPPASPSIRKMARELGIDLARVRGSEHGGRIVVADVRRYIEQIQRVAAQPARAAAPTAAVQAKPAAEAIDFAKWGPVTRQKMSTLRRTISTRMVESWTALPHVTQFDEADITDLLALRKKLAARYEKEGGHLTVTTFVIKAACAALKKYPMFNASIDEAKGEIVTKQYYHFGIAVDTEQGLIVPVIRDVDKKSLRALSIELGTLAERTRQRKVGLDEMQGGSFTISNQGGIGSGHFTPIINKPEVAILGLARGVEKPVVRDGKVVRRMILPVSLSYDHRMIDGADAARFMVEFVGALEHFKDADVRVKGIE